MMDAGIPLIPDDQSTILNGVSVLVQHNAGYSKEREN
jgi:hypothetical protein